ncbi:MAG: DUF6033 family protein [Lachnospiraceae bacterium]|nr:DUF6033 family protein [Lachnospiraceae bacterium]
MTGIQGFSAYQQSQKAWQAGKTSMAEQKAEAYKAGSAEDAKSTTEQVKGASTKIEAKKWTPISSNSLIPQKTDYGFTIGEVSLSDKAKEYYDELKAKFHNMEFIAVSKDMMAQVKQNAAAYGNANKMVVLIDEEKLERMATDENFRKKYEGIIAMAQTKLTEAKNSLTGSGASVKNFGIEVDENGNQKFFATVEKSMDLQKERIERKAEEKRQQKAHDKKKAEKEAFEKRIQKARTEKKDRVEESEDSDENIEEIAADDKEYITFESSSVDDLIKKVSDYVLKSASSRVMTDAERMLGTAIDFKG